MCLFVILHISTWNVQNVLYNHCKSLQVYQEKFMYFHICSTNPTVCLYMFWCYFTLLGISVYSYDYDTSHFSLRKWGRQHLGWHRKPTKSIILLRISSLLTHCFHIFVSLKEKNKSTDDMESKGPQDKC